MRHVFWGLFTKAFPRPAPLCPCLASSLGSNSVMFYCNDHGTVLWHGIAPFFVQIIHQPPGFGGKKREKLYEQFTRSDSGKYARLYIGCRRYAP